MAAERRNRAGAKKCLSEVLRVSDGKTKEILSAWKFGQALGIVGDDSCIRAIRAGRQLWASAAKRSTLARKNSGGRRRGLAKGDPEVA